MFSYRNHIWQSDVFTDMNTVRHGFSTRLGGVSTLPHLASMNVGFLRGDDDANVCENIRLLCQYAGAPENTVCAPQIHSTTVRYATPEMGGEGIVRQSEACDGFVTDRAGISLLIRVADCTPILLCGKRSDNSPVIAAVHAGWRGAAGGIAAVAVAEMKKLGAERICAAIGACIHLCCYTVGEDMRDEVARLRGTEFARKFVKERDGRLFADIAGINAEILHNAGVDKTDICDECTACAPRLYHSHRAAKGVRGTMGAVIGIVTP